ncbi:hypothetical protein [Pimelobacter simplex]|uniref:hypothetical protein n=1 Tax=Nocardioides simplex TaxID=2045 RepID=UPI001931BA9E|nr:hypothetical protein [Pimelobacter simplex]
MSTRRRITVTIDGRVAIFKGWQVAALLKEAGTKPIYAGTVAGWMIDRHRLADVLAYLDERNIAVTISSEEKTLSTSSSTEDELVEDGGLW